MNGDGSSDVIVGADSCENGQTGEGRAWLYLGGAGGLDLFPAWSVEGNQEWALFGFSLGTAGDVNGDGSPTSSSRCRSTTTVRSTRE